MIDPVVKIEEIRLTGEGFLESGAGQFRAYVSEYAENLRKKSLSLADSYGENGGKREITAQHVKVANVMITALLGKPRPSVKNHILHAGEVVGGVLIGIGTNRTKDVFGWALIFGGCLCTFVCYMLRESDRG